MKRVSPMLIERNNRTYTPVDFGGERFVWLRRTVNPPLPIYLDAPLPPAGASKAELKGLDDKLNEVRASWRVAVASSEYGVWVERSDLQAAS